MRSKILFLLSICTVLALGTIAFLPQVMASDKPATTTSLTSLYNIPVKSLEGEPVDLNQYKGKVLLIVNTASRCGLTGQYEGLQKLYASYQKQGLVILGFPSNDFLGQEPGTPTEIRQFCSKKFNVSFPMFQKVVVKKNRDQHPIYQWLSSQPTPKNPKGFEPGWNFAKYLVGRDGRLIEAFGSRTPPESPEITQALLQALQAKP
jgi:glutathione peroxidase